jgi:hypothetical protein
VVFKGKVMVLERGSTTLCTSHAISHAKSYTTSNDTMVRRRDECTETALGVEGGV